MNLLNSLMSLFFSEKLNNSGPSLTFARLCTSKHLRDLQQIASLTIVVFLVMLGIVISVHPKTFDLSSKLAMISALTGVAAAALNWAYQAGSRRIGSIDLFASEIGVICRVCLIVDFAKQSVIDARHRDDRNKPASQEARTTPREQFTSAEQYTPVYDNNLSDLQPLDVDVVTYVTRFYTYRKTMMDYLRIIAIATDPDRLAELKAQMIYMQYLMYESAREAIELLIEFEPNRAENIINVLCSEVVLYAFLKSRYEDDFRGRRLDLRVDEYRSVIDDLDRQMARNARNPHWKQARTTFPELGRRYRQACEDLDLAFTSDVVREERADQAV